jgi:hypothetical protein
VKIWWLTGNEYESSTSNRFFSVKPDRSVVRDFMCAQYECSLKELEKRDFTIRCFTHDIKSRWSPRKRNLNQYLDDIMDPPKGPDTSNDGNDYGTYFSLQEVEVE